jgi:riboflavin synthase
MFTGLVTAVGTVRSARPADGGRTFVIRAPFRGLSLGESIAVDGACLTVTRRLRGAFEVHVVATSLERTTFGAFRTGRRVNLERALRAGDRLGGHLVQGHVDGVGTIRRIRQQDDARLLDIAAPASVARLTVPLGSITVDGVSLTVIALRGRGVVRVSLIPYTLQHTTLGGRRVGDRVHLEGDTIGRYVAAWLSRRGEHP